MSTDSRRKGRTAVAALAGVCLMFGLAYASVPLYRLFCQVTGYGGTTQVAKRPPDVLGQREIVVRFNADVGQGMPWQFRPKQRQVTVRVGEPAEIAYIAHNPTERSITGSATFNVTPDKAGAYFAKVNCFCFEQQTLAPGETVEMPVLFFVDPSIEQDRNARDVRTITLSYTFFELQPAKPRTAAAAPASKLN
ncbi:MAG: cytochrome c oxidase assembly protein [Alphaproteobacteria bacterium]|nr:cytochrome c oxidase assembly protein [Alphaproteobacteria bacterium]